MKKRLNNIFKNKVLVSCNERELDCHEILLRENNEGKLIAKSRGYNGEIEDITGGNGVSTEVTRNIIEYYSCGTAGENTEGLNTTLMERRIFDNLLEFTDYKNYPDTGIENAKASAIFYVSTTNNDTDNCNIEVNSNLNNLFININVNKQEAPIHAFYASPSKGGFYMIGRLIYNDFDGNIPHFCSQEVGIYGKEYNRMKVVSANKIENNVACYGGLYDAKHNVMLLYSAPANLEITINSELESSFRLLTLNSTSITGTATLNGADIKSKIEILDLYIDNY